MIILWRGIVLYTWDMLRGSELWWFLFSQCITRQKCSIYTKKNIMNDSEMGIFYGHLSRFWRVSLHLGSAERKQKRLLFSQCIVYNKAGNVMFHIHWEKYYLEFRNGYFLRSSDNNLDANFLSILYWNDNFDTFLYTFCLKEAKANRGIFLFFSLCTYSKNIDWKIFKSELGRKFITDLLVM